MKLSNKLNFLFILILVLAVGSLFIGISFVMLSATSRNINFIEEEITGLNNHMQLMKVFAKIDSKTQLDKASINKIEKYYGSKIITDDASNLNYKNLYYLMRFVGDQSKLILDPKIDSYYLVNLIVRLLPDLLITTDKKIINYTKEDVYYSIKIMDEAKLNTSEIRQATDDLYNNINFVKHNDKVFRIYNIASSQLNSLLQKRLTEEKSHSKNIILITIMLFIAFVLLAIIAIKFYLNRKTYQTAQEKILLVEALEKSKEELEHFSYFTAHDLKEPIRTISCFATILEKNIANTDKDKLAIIKNSTIRMDKLVVDTLNYLATSDTGSHNFTSFNVIDVIAEVKEDLSAAITESNAEIIYDNGIKDISTNRLLFRRIIQNIISNAIFYSKKSVTPEINIDSKIVEGSYNFTIKDNGIGIEAQYLESIFVPFKKYNNDSNYKGSGLGLCICKKFVEDLGGKIWIESEFEVGTIVHITLPVA
jgi:signal transduction histidine kinase